MVKWSVDRLPALVSNRRHEDVGSFLLIVLMILLLVSVVHSGLWLEQLDPVEHLQSDV